MLPFLTLAFVEISTIVDSHISVFLGELVLCLDWQGAMVRALDFPGFLGSLLSKPNYGHGLLLHEGFPEAS